MLGMNANRATDGSAHLVLEPGRVTDVFAELESNWNVLALLYEASVDEWYRRWRTEVGWEPPRQGVVELYDLTRGAGATVASTNETHVVPGRGFALTTVQRPCGADELLSVIDEHLDRWAEEGTTERPLVYVDSLAALVADDSLDVAEQVVRAIVERVERAGGRTYFTLDGDGTDAQTVQRFRETADVVHGEPVAAPGVVAAVERLRRDDPTNFGYVRRHWAEAGEGIEASTRNYPQARQIHEHIDGPETTPRTLGATLKALATLGVIAVWDDTNGANRYDLTAYDAERFAEVGGVLDNEFA